MAQNQGLLNVLELNECGLFKQYEYVCSMYSWELRLDGTVLS